MYTLLLGGTGLLGTHLRHAFTRHHIPFRAPSRKELNVTKAPDWRKYITTYGKPHTVVYSAAYTNVDRAETDPALCHAVNVTGLTLALTLGAPVVHISSDYVFGANTTTPSTESPLAIDHPRSPQGIYAQSKHNAESLLESLSSSWWNIRTSWLYDDTHGFPTWVQKQLQAHGSCRAVHNHWGLPTHAQHLAQHIASHLTPHSIMPEGHTHYTSPGQVHSWYTWAKSVLSPQEANKLIPCTWEELPVKAVRPTWSVLLTQEQA